MSHALRCIPAKLFPDQYTSFGFFMVGECPGDMEKESSYGNFLRLHCVAADMGLTNLSLWHYLPIQIDNVVYRNIFCARCFNADLENGDMWGIFVPTKHWRQNQVVYENMDEMISAPMEELHSKNGDCLYLAPKGSLKGVGRMGGYCIPPPLTQVVPVHSSTSQIGLDEIFPKDSCAKAIERALTTRHSHSHQFGNKLYFKQEFLFGVIPDGFMDEICQKCDDLFLTLFTTNTAVTRLYVPDFWHSTMFLSGHLTVLFDGYVKLNRDLLNCSYYGELCDSDDGAKGEGFRVSSPKKMIPLMTMVVISQCGSLTSIVLMLTLLAVMKRSSNFCKTETRRLQISIIVTKIFFFVTFSLSYPLRKTASCRILAGFLHFFLWLSFAFSTILGLKISVIMWKIKNDLASMAFAHKDDRVSVREILYNVGAFGLSGGAIVTMVVTDFAAEGAIFGFGANHECMTTTEKGILYLLVVPTVVALFVNFTTTFYSGVVLCLVSTSVPCLETAVVSRVLRFLIRMVSFEGLQWIFGLIYFLFNDEIVGLLFIIFGTFEGLFIFCSLILAEIKSGRN